jgi:hypothetical protein
MGWLREHVLAQERHPERILEATRQRFRELKREPPTAGGLERMLRSTLQTFEENVGEHLFGQLSPTTTARLDALLEPPSPESMSVPLHDVRADPGPVSIETLEEELSKLALLQSLELPPNLFDQISLRIGTSAAAAEAS